jgi:hypothetical protein
MIAWPDRAGTAPMCLRAPDGPPVAPPGLGFAKMP